MKYRCVRCAAMPKGFVFEADPCDETGYGMCPKCGANHPPFIYELTDIHFMVLDPKGPIIGSWGRQYIACQPRREYLGLHAGDPFLASDWPPAVTCASCRGTKPWQDMAQLFPELRRELTLANK